MEVNLQAIAAMRAITVSREYGSGGGEIAARLARKLGWQLIDHAVIEQQASPPTFACRDSHPASAMYTFSYKAIDRTSLRANKRLLVGNHFLRV
jgi:hypothetical protein